MEKLTHKGWFYIVPIWCSETGDIMVMRWTLWSWPVSIMCKYHNLMNLIFRNDMGFPIIITGVRT